MIDKRDAQARRGIFMLDASSGFMRDGPKNRLRAQDIHKIVDIFNRRIEVPRYARLVALDEIERNDFNLNLPRYIDSQTPEDVQDIAAHLQGGIPVADVDALAAHWAVCPGLRGTLFSPNRPGYLDLAPAITADKTAIKTLIYAHPEFAAFIAGMNAHFAAWRDPSAAKLKALEPGCHPKEIIVWLSECLLAHYRDQPLVDPYDIYQHLLDYWDETLQDDCYLIAADGWAAKTDRIIETDKKGKSRDKGWTCDLIPKARIVARYFAADQATLDGLAAELETVASRFAELEEEHGGEEGAFAELDRVNKASVAARLKEIGGDPEVKGEAAVLDRWPGHWSASVGWVNTPWCGGATAPSASAPMHQRNRTPSVSSRILLNSDRCQADGPQGTFQPGSNHRVLANKLGIVDPTEIAGVELVLLERLYQAVLIDGLGGTTLGCR